MKIKDNTSSALARCNIGYELTNNWEEAKQTTKANPPKLDIDSF